MHEMTPLNLPYFYLLVPMELPVVEKALLLGALVLTVSKKITRLQSFLKKNKIKRVKHSVDIVFEKYSNHYFKYAVLSSQKFFI